MLHDRCADIERRDPDRDTTPLRYAIMYCKPELIRLFVARKANCGAIEAGGLTARELTREAAAGAFEQYDDLPSRPEYEQVAKLLGQLGVDE